MSNIKIETVRTDGFAMDYFCFGHGKEKLVILPGLSVQSVMGSADAVADAYRILTDDFTVYLFDRRKELPCSYSVSDMARDTAAVFKKLGLENVCLFGVSQGGMIALKIAIEYPELVEKLVLGSSCACIDKTQMSLFEKWIDLAKKGMADDLYLSFGQAIFPDEVFEQARQTITDAAKTVTNEDLERFAILCEGVRSFDVTREAGCITCPTFIIGAADDKVLGPKAAEQLFASFNGRQNAKLYMYNGFGHAAYDTAPDYKQRILNFLLCARNNTEEI